MAEHKIAEIVLDVTELKRLAGLSARQRSKDLLNLEIRKLDTELAKLRSMLEADAAIAVAEPAAPPTAEPAAANAVVKRYRCELTQYAFDQSDKFVKLFVTLDGVQACPEANVKVVFTESSITLAVLDLNNKDYQLTINNLLEPIITAASHRKIKSDMVVIYAKKRNEGSNWSELTLIEKRVRENKANELVTGGGLDLSKDPGTDPNASIMNLMQKMYNSGDSQMKQIISKAWTEGEEKRRAGME